MGLIYTLIPEFDVPLYTPVRVEETYGTVYLIPSDLMPAANAAANTLVGTTDVIYKALLREVWEHPSHARYHDHLELLTDMELEQSDLDIPAGPP